MLIAVIAVIGSLVGISLPGPNPNDVTFNPPDIFASSRSLHAYRRRYRSFSSSRPS